MNPPGTADAAAMQGERSHSRSPRDLTLPARPWAHRPGFAARRCSSTASPYVEAPSSAGLTKSAVRVVERWLMSRLRHTVLADVHATDAALSALLPSLNERRFQKLEDSRAILFAALDAPTLSALPAQRWQWATSRRWRCTRLLRRGRWAPPQRVALVGGLKLEASPTRWWKRSTAASARSRRQ